MNKTAALGKNIPRLKYWNYVEHKKESQKIGQFKTNNKKFRRSRMCIHVIISF